MKLYRALVSNESLRPLERVTENVSELKFSEFFGFIGKFNLLNSVFNFWVFWTSKFAQIWIPKSMRLSLGLEVRIDCETKKFSENEPFSAACSPAQFTSKTRQINRPPSIRLLLSPDSLSSEVVSDRKSSSRSYLVKLSGEVIQWSYLLVQTLAILRLYEPRLLAPRVVRSIRQLLLIIIVYNYELCECYFQLGDFQLSSRYTTRRLQVKSKTKANVN